MDQISKDPEPVLNSIPEEKQILATINIFEKGVANLSREADILEFFLRHLL